jgi:oligoribonuclease NrnB/cAMP/cGMP phosphodiesterase (DHH superfamily)
MKVLVFTDNDLDGAGSALALRLIYGDKATVEIHEVYDVEITSNTLSRWLPEFDHYDRVYFTDVYITEDTVPYIDRKNVVIIDHHHDHVAVKDRYKTAKVIIEPYSSCTRLITEKFKLTSITPEQKLLLDVIDDYDSYTLKFKETLRLHAIYTTYNRPKVMKFIESFENGLREFNTMELNSIKLYFNKLKEQLNTTFFTGKIKDYKIVGCIADFAINEVAHFALKKYDADIAFVVNVNYGGVSFRRSKTCDAKLNVIANKLCDGGGHEYAAGGKLTQLFQDFTKTLQPC